MTTEQIISVIVAVLSGLATCIPLALKLVQYVKKATQEKNWAGLLDLVMKLMEQAEKKFADGATRKEWVMAMVQTSAEYVQYPMDVQALSEMIDQLTNLTKNVNLTKETKYWLFILDKPALMKTAVLRMVKLVINLVVN